MEISLKPEPTTNVKNSIGKQKLELIQAFRGLAALLVLLFHVSELSQQKLQQSFLWNIFDFGSAGVDFFFVLSGFIIFFIHRKDMGHKEKLKQFILKRFIRIYPLYWIVTLTLLPIYFMIPTFGFGYERNPTVIIKSLLLYPQDNFPILVVGWTLSYEIFFYLMFSLTMFLPLKLARKIIFGWLIGTVILFMATLVTQFDFKEYFWIWFIFNSRNLEFILGCLAGYWISKHSVKQKAFLLFTGSFLFIWFGLLKTYNVINLDPVIAYGITSTLIIIGAVSLELKKSLNVPSFLCNLGDASYSIYLIHYPCLSILFKIALAARLVSLFGYYTIMIAIICITLALGIICHLYIENKLVNYLRIRLIS